MAAESEGAGQEHVPLPGAILYLTDPKNESENPRILQRWRRDARLVVPGPQVAAAPGEQVE